MMRAAKAKMKTDEAKDKRTPVKTRVRRIEAGNNTKTPDRKVKEVKRLKKNLTTQLIHIMTNQHQHVRHPHPTISFRLHLDPLIDQPITINNQSSPLLTILTLCHNIQTTVKMTTHPISLTR